MSITKAGGNPDVFSALKKKAPGNPKAMTARKFGGRIGGTASAARLDRPGRKLGGRVGADSAPLSSAGKVA